MSAPLPSLVMNVRLHMDYEKALARTVEALKTEGLCVLTEINVQGAVKQNLIPSARPQKILGAYHPALAHRARSLAPEIGQLMPFNVTLSYVSKNVTEVALVDPLSMLVFFEKPALEPVALAARALLERVAIALREDSQNQ